MTGAPPPEEATTLLCSPAGCTWFTTLSRVWHRAEGPSQFPTVTLHRKMSLAHLTSPSCSPRLNFPPLLWACEKPRQPTLPRAHASQCCRHDSEGCPAVALNRAHRVQQVQRRSRHLDSLCGEGTRAVTWQWDLLTHAAGRRCTMHARRMAAVALNSGHQTNAGSAPPPRERAPPASAATGAPPGGAAAPACRWQ